jgi:DNA-binding transcriptional LysR family regulator
MHIRMNWSAITFDWNQVRAFLATAEEGSLSAAARALGLTQPTLGRQVTGLEERLGVTLFERAGRGLLLTQSGRDLLDHVRAMGEAATRVALVAAGRAEGIAGRVCISASDATAAYVLPDLMVELADLAPEIEIEILSTNSLSDLLRREADIAIRHVRPEEPDLVARLIRERPANLYAAPTFLRRYGRPKTMEDLRDLPFIGMASPERMAAELKRMGIAIEAKNFRVHSESTVAGWEMVRRGLGIGIMAEDIARHTGGVERIVPSFPPIPVQLWLTTHREIHNSKRIRLVFDFLAEALAR